MPFACAGGVCGTCRARVVDGSVTMTENYALEPDELERGYVLTCQSHPTSDRVVVDYDVCPNPRARSRADLKPQELMIEIHDGVAEVVLDAPEKLNALGESAIAELGDAYDQAEASRGCARSSCAARDARSAPGATSPASTRATTTSRATWAGSSSPC